MWGDLWQNVAGGQGSLAGKKRAPDFNSEKGGGKTSRGRPSFRRKARIRPTLPPPHYTTKKGGIWKARKILWGHDEEGRRREFKPRFVGNLAGGERQGAKAIKLKHQEGKDTSRGNDRFARSLKAMYI